MNYCESIFKTVRWKTREVSVGHVKVGGGNPVRIQSMTTSNTRDVEATASQIMRLSDVGCEIARVTVQGIKEAEACEGIKNSLIQKGYTIPVVADIHFFPPAAMKACEFVDKIRINPGNFVDKRASFKTIEYTETLYAEELYKIEEKFTPLVQKCKTLKRAMRIGTNHGSLSDRIMNRYGDTPQGMVESALEFARICRKNDYHDLFFSMKSSNPQVMIQAYRLLVANMISLGWDYPLHLGVTEAGEGEDGRVKSAIGIGSLLLDGIGDTIRVSLTEDPWHEIDPCMRLVKFGEDYLGQGVDPFTETHRNPQDIKRRTLILPQDIGMHRDGTVILSINPDTITSPDFYKDLGCDVVLGRPKIKISSVDLISLEKPPTTQVSLKYLTYLQDAGIRQLSSALKVSDGTPWDSILTSSPSLIILSPSKNRLHYARHFFEWLQEKKLPIPVILNFSYTCSKEDLIIQAAAECGSLLCDGLGDGLFLEGPYEPSFLRTLSFNILQAARMRKSKTDFISCPSCGRTLFNLQDVTKLIHARTSHLPGVKIAIMGCIVNGPGEMADADFGYVGSKPGKIDLYVGKQCVEKDIASEEACERLVELIKNHGRWIEPELSAIEPSSIGKLEEISIRPLA
jgi:(E)-4-hydroxy-3-methylbut-2-enyl-diphosphate synthase